MKDERKVIEYRGLICEARIIVGDWEGDPSIPNGVRELPPYCEDIYIHAPGDDYDLYNMFTDEAIEEIIEELLS